MILITRPLAPVKPLELDLWMSHTEAVADDLVDIYCGAKDLQSPQPEYVILINGQDLPGETRADKLAARLALTEGHFLSGRSQVRGGRRDRDRLRTGSGSGSVTVECLASLGGRLVANITRAITRASHRRGKGLVGDTSGVLVARHQAASYSHLLLEAKHSSGSFIVGQVSGDVMENLQNPRTSYGGRLETSEDPIEILRILGYFGYNVVAMANTPDNRIIWTLTRRDFSVNNEL